ncbi:alpha/beta fold hydrolase [Chitinophaga filiformis]|uniref:Alpha/beta hydrolase n=1 Tax=Chitinophaga filiformis TaxID=104663 RepID=A0ABY4HWU8_CHIFI|nr:alpha/beta fold hydrolase [Chitinophaga filiformis]UPK68080.1 alpha/beta hydrolase [Chitinophaga filiformis]
MNTNVQNGYITIDDIAIYYEVQGSGYPLLLIPSMGGDSWWFYKIANHLSCHFKVITYDMRGCGRSIANQVINFEISRHCDDISALLDSLGEQPVYIAGFSSGSVIACEMAIRYPSLVKAMLLFEPPMVRIHPRHKKLHSMIAGVYRTAFRYGPIIAGLKFVWGAGLPLQPLLKGGAEQKQYLSQTNIKPKQISLADQYLEFVIVTNYQPNIEKLNLSGVRIFTGAGKDSLRKKRFYAQTAELLAASLKCKLVVFPGHHFSFFHSAADFAQVLKSAFLND